MSIRQSIGVFVAAVKVAALCGATFPPSLAAPAASSSMTEEQAGARLGRTAM
jgi:hypothetical protein